MNEKRNFVILPGSRGTAGIEWIKQIRDELAKVVGDDRVTLVDDLPFGSKISFREWSYKLDALYDCNVINEHTVFVTHSIGGACVVKYAAKNDLEIAGLFAVAAPGNTKFIRSGIMRSNIPGVSALVQLFTRAKAKPFMPSRRNHEKFRGLCPTRHSFYSRLDYFLKQESLDKFAAGLMGTRHQLDEITHAGARAKLNSIPELIGIIHEQGMLY